MKYLVLNFENARYYKTHNETKDFMILSPKTKCSRKDAEHFVEEGLTIYQISNVLHVLFRERPVPSLRKVNYSIIESIYELAAKSYLKYDNTIPMYEIIQTKKSVSDSYNPIAYFSWHRVEKLCEHKFETVLDIFTKYTCIVKPHTKFTYNEFIEKARVLISDKEGFKEELKNLAVTPLYDTIYGTSNNELATINKNKRTILTVNSAFDHAKMFGGVIYVPVSDDDISFLRKYSKGACTILDGGLVKIAGVVDDECDFIPNFEEDGYVLVDTINKEKELKTGRR